MDGCSRVAGKERQSVVVGEPPGREPNAPWCGPIPVARRPRVTSIGRGRVALRLAALFCLLGPILADAARGASNPTAGSPSAGLAPWIRGRVVRGESPAAGVDATLERPTRTVAGAGSSKESPKPPAVARVATDARGLFVLKAPDLGPWTVRIEPRAGSSFECAVPLLPLEIDLPPLDVDEYPSSTEDPRGGDHSSCWRSGADSAPPDAPSGGGREAAGERAVREIRGRVVDAGSGSALVGSWVRAGGELFRIGDDGGFHIEVTTVALPPEASAKDAQTASATPAAKPGDARETQLEVAAVGFGSRLVPIPPLEDAASATLYPWLEIALAPRSIAEGFVVDEAGHGVEGVELRAELAVPAREGRSTDGASSSAPPAERGDARYSRSGPHGEFRLQQLVPRILYVLDATTFEPVAIDRGAGAAPRREPARGELRFSAPGPRETRGDLRVVVVRRRPGFGWVMTHVDGVEQPVAGAVVTLQRDYRSGVSSAPLTARSSDAGRFELEHLPPGRYDLLVRSPGHAPAQVKEMDVPLSDEPWEIGTVLLGQGVALEVRVRDGDREPIAGAAVSLWSRVPRDAEALLDERGLGGSWYESVARTDEEGAAHVADLGDGEDVRLRIAAPGFVAVERGPLRVPAPEPIEVVLERGGAVRGVVFDEDGRRIRGAFVRLHPDGWLPATPLDLYQYTDEPGAFAFDGVPAGAFRLIARAEGAADFDPLPLRIAAGETLEGVELREPESAVVEGRVRAADGTPVAGAVVVAAAQLARTGEDGGFRLDKVRCGLQRLEVRADERGSAQRDIEVPPTGTWVEVELGGAAEVLGVVVDTDGAPVAGVVVMARAVGRDASGRSESTAHTDSSGAFRFGDLVPGDHRVWVEESAWLGVDRSSMFAEASLTPSPMRLVVEPVVARLVGRVLGLRPGEQATVLVRRHDGQGVGGSRAEDARYGDDRYLVPRLPAGELEVIARVNRNPYEPSSREIATASAILVVEPGDGEIVLDLELERRELARSAVRGTVRVDGEAIEKLWLMLVPAVTRQEVDEGPYSVATDALGRFEFCCVAPGHYRLMAGTTSSVLAVLSSLLVETDIELPLDLRRMAVRGEVVDAASGQPVAGAVLNVSGPFEPTGLRSTDAQGRFELQAIVLHGLLLRIEHDSHGPQEIWLEPAPLVDLGVLSLQPHGQ